MDPYAYTKYIRMAAIYIERGTRMSQSQSSPNRSGGKGTEGGREVARRKHISPKYPWIGYGGAGKKSLPGTKLTRLLSQPSFMGFTNKAGAGMAYVDRRNELNLKDPS